MRISLFAATMLSTLLTSSATELISLEGQKIPCEVTTWLKQLHR